ncbi:MAG: GAF domain-containing protein [Deltaproteobacteria bacterium]|nr:GAF domain-containing protein [Deltaproteobacteria bacterium]
MGAEVGARIDRIAADLLAASREPNLAEIVVARAADALSGYGSCLGIVDEPTRTLRLRATHGFAREMAQALRVAPLDSQQPACVAARTGRPLVVSTFAEYVALFPDFYAKYGATLRTRALVYAPVLHEGRSIGSLGVSFDHDRVANADDVAVLEALARFASRALQRP